MSSSSFNCKFNSEDGQLPTALETPLTVGAEMMLVCEGAGPEFDIAKLKADALNSPEHTVKLLKYEVKGSSFFVTLTPYRVGEFQNVSVLLTDGKNAAKTSPVSWKVQSVIDPNNPEAARPFGPFGPWAITWPWWYFLILAITILLAAVSGLRAWRLSRRRLEVQRKIRDYREKYSPFDQFQKVLRRLDREYQINLAKSAPTLSIFEELQKASLTYLMMEFELDTEKKSPRWIVRRLKRKAPKAKDAVLNDLALFLGELKRRDENPEVEKVIEWAGRLSEKVDRESFGITK